MIGRLRFLAIGRNQEQAVTIDLRDDFREQFESLRGCDVDVEIKKHRERRSRDANAYAWVLINRIAAAQSVDRVTVYHEAIRSIGGVSEIVCVKDEAVDKLRRGWQHNGIGWITDVMPSRISGCTNVILYYGSSVYDTKQMSCLIDHLIQDAQALGIETATPEELDRMKSLWGTE